MRRHGELGFPHVDEVKDVSYAAAVGRQEEQSVVETALLAVKTTRSPPFKSGEMASVNEIEKQPRKPRMMGPFECLLTAARVIISVVMKVGEKRPNATYTVSLSAMRETCMATPTEAKPYLRGLKMAYS